MGEQAGALGRKAQGAEQAVDGMERKGRSAGEPGMMSGGWAAEGGLERNGRQLSKRSAGQPGT